MSKASTAISIPDRGDTHIKQETQYGVVWPDGTTTWQFISRGPGGTQITIAALVPGADTTGHNESSVKWSASYWDELLENRASAALLDVEEYRDRHRFIKRTVVLAVTAAEEA